jgi:hypothetical protein
MEAFAQTGKERRPGGWVTACLWLVMLASSPSAIGAEVQPHTVLAGKNSAFVINATDGATLHEITGLKDIRAAAIDDRRDHVWLLDTDGRLLRYGLDGGFQQHIDVENPGAHAWLAVDPHDGSVWLANNQSLNHYDINGGMLHTLTLASDATAMTFDNRHRRVWLGVKKQLLAVDADGNIVHDILQPKDIEALAFDLRRGIVWAGMNNQVAGIDAAGAAQHGFNVQRLDHIAVASDSTLWVAKTKTLYHYTPSGTLLQTINLPPAGPPVWNIAVEPNNGSLWITRDHFLLQRHADGSIDTVLDGLKVQRALAANGDINAPTATLISPEDDALIPPRPELRIDVADIGLGVDPAATALHIDGEPAAIECTWENEAPSPPSGGEGWGEGVMSCIPVDPITAYYPELEITVHDYAGNAAETLNVRYRLDTDGDGVEDGKDTYPQDPTRYRLAPVTGIETALEEDALEQPDQVNVHIRWQAHEDPEKTAGYLIYKREHGQDARTLLTPEPLTALEFNDPLASNGTGYVYEVLGVDALGNEGDPGEGTPFFAAWNHQPASGLTAARELAAGRLDWDAQPPLRYRVYRSESNADGEYSEFAAVQDVSEATWLDESTLWHIPYRYTLATLRDFTDVFTGEAIVKEGPISAAIDLPPLPPLTIALNDGAPGEDSLPEILIRQSPMGVAGSYSEARGPLDVVAIDNAGNTVTATADPTAGDNGFRLMLPAAADAQWSITLSEQWIPDRTATVAFRFVADTEAPQITFADGLAAETEDEFFYLQGAATDRLTGIATLTAVSDRYGPQAFGLVQGEAGSFSGEVPLEYGDNTITVSATDGVGNTASATHTVKRRAPLQPTLQLDTPHDGLITQASHINVAGRVYTGLAADKVRIVLGGNVQFPASGSSTEGYPFAFEGVALREGYNLISVNVETPAGSDTESVVVTFEPEPPPPPEPEPPELALSTGDLDIITNGDSLYIGGSVAGEGDITVTVNGETVNLIGDNFEYFADLAECIDGTATFVITVTDATGLSTTETITVDCDRSAPVVNVTSPSALAAPAITTLPGNPVQFAGSVSDANLAGLTINGTPVTLSPAAGAGHYTFDTQVLLPANATLPVQLEARDAAGNRTLRDYVLQVASQIGIEIITPLDNVDYLAQDHSVPATVTARFTNFDPAVHQAFAQREGASPVPFIMSANTGNVELELPAEIARQKITVSVREGSNTLASRHVSVNVTRAADIPLEVARTEPENNAAGIAPIDPITLYFNKPVDPQKLVVSVKETVHGMDYDLSVPEGAGYGELPKPKLIEINRDMEGVAGGLAWVEGNRFVTFHPARRFAYGADVYIDAVYDGEELLRFAYQVQPLPTIIAGAVLDEFSQPVKGIEVQIPARGLRATTDHEGNFSFGTAGNISAPIQGGMLEVVINPDLKNLSYGTSRQASSIQFQRTNLLRPVVLPVLDTRIPFSRIRSGQGIASLSSGQLKLDLSSADLVFPNGRNEGNVHVQMRMRARSPVEVESALNVDWLYALQPAGIRVDGAIDVAIRAPLLLGNTDYLPPDETLVVLVAYSKSQARVRAVGVGRLQNGIISSSKPLHIDSLDYLGYSFVLPEKQAVLQKFVDGEITSMDALVQALE